VEVVEVVPRNSHPFFIPPQSSRNTFRETISRLTRPTLQDLSPENSQPRRLP
jgi:hypothetical protein